MSKSKNDPALGYKALGTLVMVKEQTFNEVTKGGVLLPTVSQNTQFLTIGTVVSYGRGYHDNGVLVNLEVVVGDRVLFAKTAANVWKDPETREEFMFIPASNLLAIVPANE